MSSTRQVLNSNRFEIRDAFEHRILPCSFRIIRQLFARYTSTTLKSDLSPQEFENIIILFNVPFEFSIDKLFEIIGTNNRIDFDQYILIMQYMSTTCLIFQDEISICDLFRIIDCDEDGFIDFEELSDFMSMMQKLDHGKHLNIGNMKKLYVQIDRDGSGTIDFDEWATAFFRSQLYEYFGIPKNKIVLERREFRKLMVQYGISLYKANELFNHIDLDKNGTLDIDEIKNYQDLLIADSGYFSNFMFEWVGLLIQLAFCCTTIARLAIDDDATWASWIALKFKMATVASYIVIFLRLIFREEIMKMKIIKALYLE